MENAYTEESIQSFSGVDAVRKRFTMYINDAGTKGVFRLVQEIIGNSLDEFQAGRASDIYIDIDEPKQKIKIRDNGAGIPIGKIIDCATELHTGGKFDNLTYNFSIGLNGVGLTSTNALSKQFGITVWRDGKEAKVEFSKGHITKDLDVHDIKASGLHGTLVEFVPDEEILGEYIIVAKHYSSYFEELALINTGVRIHYTYTTLSGDTDAIEYYSTDGIFDLLKRMLGHHTFITTDAIRMPFIEINAKDKMGFECAFSWVKDAQSEKIRSFVNGINTPDGGMHVKGMKGAIAEIIRSDLNNNVLAKSDPLYGHIETTDIFEGFIAVILAKHQNPLFAGQVKSEFTSIEFEPFARDEVRKRFAEWSQLNKTRYKSILDVVQLTAKARIAASNARKAVKASAATTTHTALISIDKYRPCHSKDPSKCELFIVEGESAGGSAKSGGDGEYQAIYMLRGVPPNVYDSQNILKYLNTEGSVIGDLVKVIGCGMGASFDISKLRFYRIVLMTDADPDGSHISSLLIGFFFSFYPELILAGKVFLANPPLFRFGFNKNREFYVPNMEAYWNILDSSIIKDFDLCAIHKNKGFVINNVKFYQQYLYYLRGYFDIVDIAGKQTNILPELLEYIIIKYNDIIKSKVFRFQNYEFNVYWDKSLNCNVIEGIYNNIFHKIELTSELQDTCKQMIIKLQNVHWSNLILRHKKSGTIIGPSPYIISKTIDRVVQSSADVTRYKGLGEMRPKQLYETTMNPATRTLTQIKMDPENIKRYASQLDIFIGSNIDGRKEYYRKFL